MGREVRRVPANWEHPRNERGHHIPLFDSAEWDDQLKAMRPISRDEFMRDVLKWYDDQRLWALGQHPDYDPTCRTLTEWSGAPPNPDERMPFWDPSERTHYQMYQNVSEGTPISPVCATPEELARWLADNRASASGSDTGEL